MQQKVLFKHCDPAGIVFFPRYFEMMNDCMEIFFDKVLGAPFEELHKVNAVPTASISTRFTAPSRHGDQLTLSLSIDHVGRSSARYTMKAHAEEELRFETEGTLVFVGHDGRPQSWPSELRTSLIKQKELAA